MGSVVSPLDPEISKVPSLHKFIQDTKLLIELLLDVDLQVIHVPGTAMITQSTDGLSREV